MSNDAPYNSELSDNSFAIVRDADIPWSPSTSGLPPGVMHKRLHVDPVMQKRTGKVKFPPGYLEPAHYHRGWHCLMVMEGRMCVAGKELLPGDFVFGWDVPHGPFEYPDGCVVYTVAMGDLKHEFDWDAYLVQERQWEPKTEEGREGVKRIDAWRKEEKARRDALK